MIVDDNEIHKIMSSINKAWKDGRPEQMGKYIHPNIVMKLPGFSGDIIGREEFLAGFKEFCTNAQVLEYNESDEQINVIGNTAIISYKFEMNYERPNYRNKSTGRDFWIFEKQDEKWLAIWRTMMDLNEVRLLDK